jgi:tryptophan 2,3-dioxygenase
MTTPEDERASPRDAPQPNTWSAVKWLSDMMAEDEGLWFIAHYASEAYLQQALRDLCAAIDEAASTERGEANT